MLNAVRIRRRRERSSRGCGNSERDLVGATRVRLRVPVKVCASESATSDSDVVRDADRVVDTVADKPRLCDTVDSSVAENDDEDQSVGATDKEVEPLDSLERVRVVVWAGDPELLLEPEVLLDLVADNVLDRTGDNDCVVVIVTEVDPL